jgi:signal transduction histidine kinase
MRNRLYIAGYTVILVLAALALRHMWQQHLDTRLLIAEDGMEEAANQIESLVQQSASHVTMLRVTAEHMLRDLAHGHQNASGLDDHLDATPDGKGYCSEAGHTPQMSSVSGLGAMPPSGSPLRQEIDMALLLAPQFAATAENIPNMAWAYYTSAGRFIAMYPNTSCQDFFFSEELYEHEFFNLGRPPLNPLRRQFWTSAYVDEAGKGLMATIGAPVYDGAGEFRGTVAIDLTLQTLSRYVVGQRLSDGRLLIVNPQGQVLADRSLLVGNIAFGPRLTEVLPRYDYNVNTLVFSSHQGFTASHGELFASRPIAGTPWRLVYVTDQLALHTQAWLDSGVEVGGLLLLILVIVAFETARRRSQQLKQHVAELAEANTVAVKARRDADDANRAKSIMMANVSHDLRTPLNAIIGFSDLMQHQLFGSLSARYLAYVEDIKSSGELLLRIINNLLDLAKVESGQYQLQEEVVDLGALVETCRAMMAEQAREAGLALEARIASNLPRVKVDPRALQRVVLNLLSNAVKFTKAGGAVTVTVWVDPKFCATIAVADTGAGISKRNLDHLFRPFTRGDSALTANSEGTGLGLSIVKSLVDLHGGKVSMESALGVGTNVTVQLPAWRNERRDLPAAAQQPAGEAGVEGPRDAAA